MIDSSKNIITEIFSPVWNDWWRKWFQ